MNKTFFSHLSPHEKAWRLVNAAGKTVGRLATELAHALRGKDKPEYTPFSDCGDYLVVINADKVVFTGKKMADKVYPEHSGWSGGRKEVSVSRATQSDPAFVLRHAIKGMLPKNTLSRRVFEKLKIYAGENHPHAAQLSQSK